MASMRSINLAALVALLAILGGANGRRLLADYKAEYSSPPVVYNSPPKEYSSPPPPKEYYSSPPPPKEYYSTPPPPKEYYSSPPPPREYYFSPPPPKAYYSPPKEDYKHPSKPYSPPDNTYEPSREYGCEEYAQQCDFKFLNGELPTFELIAQGDNAYGPIIVDKDNYATKVLNINGKCKIVSSYHSYESSHDDDSYDSDDSYHSDDSFHSYESYSQPKSYDTKDCTNYFYFHKNRVATRTFNIRPVEEFKGKCIRLDITSAQLWNNINLNPHDGNKDYPERRRCVVFKTA